MKEQRKVSSLMNPDCRVKPLCNFGESIQKAGYPKCFNKVEGVFLDPTKNSDLFIIIDFVKVFNYVGTTERFLTVEASLKGAGHFNSILEDANIEKGYITSCVKCAVGIGNYEFFRSTKPTVSNIKICGSIYLKRELERLKPKVILLVGQNPLKLFNLTGKLQDIQGTVYDIPFPKWEESPVFKVIPVMDPKVLIYNNSNRLYQKILSVFKRAYELSQDIDRGLNLNSDDSYTLLDTQDKVDSFISEKLPNTKLLAFDTETFDLSLNSPVLCVSMATGKGEKYILPVLKNNNNIDSPQFTSCFDDNYLRKVLKKILQNEIPKIGHNIKYDYNVVLNRFGVKPQGFLIDTLILHHLINEEPPHNLEFLLDIEFGYGSYSSELKKIINKGTRHYGHIPNEILWKYSAIDAEGCYRLATERYVPYLQNNKPRVWKLYMDESEPLIRALAKAERYGHKVNLPILYELKKEYESELDSLLAKLKQHSFPEFNPNSTPSREKAFKLLISDKTSPEQAAKIKEVVYDPVKDKVSTDQERLLNLKATFVKNSVPFIDYLIEYRQKRKILGTYINKILDSVDENGFIRLNWNIAGTKTGRLSCSLGHQIPKIDEHRWKNKQPVLRQVFMAPEGYKYIYADASQVELRIFAAVTQDQILLNAFNENIDLHKLTASIFLDIPIEEVNAFNRVEIGKRLNFGLIYGSQGAQIVKQGKWMDKEGKIRPITWDFFNEGLKRWKKTFKNAGKFFDQVELEAILNNGTITTVYGRERHFKGIIEMKDIPMYKMQYKKALREMVNTKIQSVAASLTNRTIVKIDQILNSKIEKGVLNESDILLSNTVHDSLAYICKEHLVDWFVKVIIQITSKPIPELSNLVFPFEIGIGDNWAEAEYATK